MPAVVIIVTMLIGLGLMGTSEASPSCASKTDARQLLGSLHLYRHGRDPCWDAVPGLGDIEQAHRDRRAIESPRPNDPTPERLPEDARWIGTDRPAPPSIVERRPAPADMPRGVGLVAVVIVVTLAAIEALVRGPLSSAGGAATDRNRGRP